MSSVITRVKVAWSLLPANARLAVQTTASSALGAAKAALAVYVGSGGSITTVKAWWPLVLAAAVSDVLLHFTGSPIPGYKWDRAVEKGEAVERRSSPPVLPPEVIVVPETPPGNPVSKNGGV